MYMILHHLTIVNISCDMSRQIPNEYETTRNHIIQAGFSIDLFRKRDIIIVSYLPYMIRGDRMDFKTYVQSVVASYVEKHNKNLVFIKHYNTLDITKSEILANVDRSAGMVFLYHEYSMHEMHSSYSPFLEWIQQCYNAFYKDKMSVEDFLRACGVYSLHIEPIAGFIRDGLCSRKEDVLYFEIQYETFRMLQSILSIIEYISKEHNLVMILSKFHLAPFSTIRLFRAIVEQSVKVHAILMYNDEFIITDYKRAVWNDLLQASADQDLQLEWGSLDSERTMDVQDEFWYDNASFEDYLIKLKNMYYTFSIEDAVYYVNNIVNRLDENTIMLSENQSHRLIQLAAQLTINSRQVNQALVMCDKMTAMQCQNSTDPYVKYMYYYIHTKVRMVLSEVKLTSLYCRRCVEIAESLGDSFLACKAEILLWCACCGMGKDIFEYDFTYKVGQEVVEKAKQFGFINFLAYLYVFGFENDSDTMREIAAGTLKPHYFEMGIHIGTIIGNDNFLLNAYMKNIILYSRAGYHSYVRDMYVKRLSVLRRPNPLRESHMLAGLGYNSIIIEDYEKAHSYLIQSVLNLTELEQPDDVMNSLYNLAMDHFVAEDYAETVRIIELIIKMLKEMGYHTIGACSTMKLYSLIAVSCYYQKEYYNSYYFLSKMEVMVEHMILVLQKEEGTWDEDLLLYHLVKGLLYNYEDNPELCLREFEEVKKRADLAPGASFFAVPISCTELASLCLRHGMKEQADEVVAFGIEFCKKEGLKAKEQRLRYFIEHGERQTEPLFKKDDPLPTERMVQLARHAGTQIKLERREKAIKFLTVLQEAISRENMNIRDLYSNTSAAIKNSYDLDEIIILRRKDGKRELMRESDGVALSDEQFDSIFDFFRVYKQAFLSNRSDKNFNQFLPIVSVFHKKPIMTMIGIPLLEASGTETVFLGYVRVKRRSIGSRILLNGDDLMILKFAFSQFCEMMKRIDSRMVIERMNRQLEQSAITDHLTGITNRNGFSRQAEVICSPGNDRDIVLLYLDLDNFKYYNDTFGHDVGDLVLVNFAELFKRMTKGNGLAVRYGGDEFIILLYDKTEHDGELFAEQIYREISSGFVDEVSAKLNREISIPDEKKISCSIGIAAFKGGSKYELESALNHADEMLYDVKRNGKSYYKLYRREE